MDGRSDNNLIAACRTGDRNAYAVLIDKYYRQAFLVCMGMLGNIHDAEDIAQEAMLKGFVDIKKLRDSSQFGTWLMRIAKNMCINLVRSKVRRRTYNKKAVEEKMIQPNQTKTRNDSLEQAIEKLPAEIRLPLAMYYFDGQSAKMVAEKLNISRPTVYLRLRAATKQLHELLVKQGDQNE